MPNHIDVSPGQGLIWRPGVLAVAAVALTAAVTGCGGGSARAAGRAVASIAATGQHRPSTRPSGPPALQGVTIPDNASQVETKRIMNAWSSCLQAHGDTDFGTKSGGMRVPAGAIPPAAEKACTSLTPHAPWQEIPQYNPHYNQDMAKWVNCMNARGVPVTPVPGGWNYNGPSKLSSAKQDQVTVQCEMNAFNEH